MEMKNSSSHQSTLGIAVAIIVVLILAAYVFFGDNVKNSDNSAGQPIQADPSLQTVSIQAPKGTISALIADTPQSKEKGLGGRASLPTGQGMLFIFSEPGMQAFWMKDMKFALDMVWIGADKKIAGISADISQNSYPQVFFPPSPVLYVLELNAGSAKSFGLATGTDLIF